VALVICCVSGALAGCASIGTWDPPEISLVDLRLLELTTFETSATVEIRLANTNLEPMTATGASYGLYIDGLKVGQVLSDEVVDVAPLSSAVQTAELRMSNLALATRLRALLESKAFDYEIRGKVYIDTGVRTRRVRVEHAGFFDFERQSEGTPAS
jgi:LEA14-like dessication related protein